MSWRGWIIAELCRHCRNCSTPLYFLIQKQKFLCDLTNRGIGGQLVSSCFKSITYFDRTRLLETNTSHYTVLFTKHNLVDDFHDGSSRLVYLLWVTALRASSTTQRRSCPHAATSPTLKLGTPHSP